MDERQDPGARLRPLGPEAGRRAPDAEEGLLHRILGEPVVAQHAECEAVCHPPDAVVELGQRSLVVACDERHEGLVREMSKVPAHGPGVGRVAQRYHGEVRLKHHPLFASAAVNRFDIRAARGARRRLSSANRTRSNRRCRIDEQAATRPATRRCGKEHHEEGIRTVRPSGRCCDRCRRGDAHRPGAVERHAPRATRRRR